MGKPSNWCPVGTVRIRRFTRSKDERAFVKVAEPSEWKLRAHVVWEAANGPIPSGGVIHHRDGNKLRDVLENLELLTVAAHLAEHLPEFQTAIVDNLVRARRERRWSTKSKAKRTGRPPTCDPMALAAAVEAVRGGISAHAASAKFGVPRTTLYRLTR